jgi:hypothetical protein
MREKKKEGVCVFVFISCADGGMPLPWERRVVFLAVRMYGIIMCSGVLLPLLLLED